MTDDEFEEELTALIGEVNMKIGRDVGTLMDLNHRSMLHSRRVIMELKKFQNRYDDIIDDLVLCHANAMKQISDMYGDMLLREQGMEATDDSDEEESGEVEEE